MSADTAAAPVATPCGSADFGLNVGDANGPAVEKARQIYDAALACDKAAIVQQIRTDGTKLHVWGGTDSADEFFAFDDPQDRYFVMTALMSTRPGFEDGTLYWPYIEDGADWPDLGELAHIGLWPDSSPPDDGPSFYTGWRIGFGPAGEFGWFLAGD